MLSCKTLGSSIGKKVIMAVTGLLLLGFVVGHLLGNLTIFGGPDMLNAYAKKLQSLGPGLWVARISLLIILTAHVFTAIRLTLENKAAKGQDYVCKKTIQTTYAARTMMVSGILVFVYIVYHLLHFTLKVTNPDISHGIDHLGRHDVYSMVVLSFQNGFIALVYIVANFILCNHLRHGISSLVQSLGLNSEDCIARGKTAALVISSLLFIGYASIPAAVFLGLVAPATGGGH